LDEPDRRLILKPLGRFTTEGLFAFPQILQQENHTFMSPQAGFMLLNEIVPRLRAALPNAVCLVGCEDAEELIQDATAIAAKILDRVEARQQAATPGNIAYYATKLTRQGRRSTGQRQNDPLNPLAQLSGRCRLVSLDAPLTSETDGEEIMCLHDSLAAKTEDPAMTAARRLD
jgi:hypothetical protein